MPFACFLRSLNVCRHSGFGAVVGDLLANHNLYLNLKSLNHARSNLISLPVHMPSARKPPSKLTDVTAFTVSYARAQKRIEGITLLQNDDVISLPCEPISCSTFIKNR